MRRRGGPQVFVPSGARISFRPPRLRILNDLFAIAIDRKRRTMLVSSTEIGRINMKAMRTNLCLGLFAVLMGFGAVSGNVSAQTVAPPQADTSSATPENAVLLTVFLKHDQSRPLGELNAQLMKQGFYKEFPPAGVEIVSWYVAMGIGQIITLRLPATRLREVNRVLETTAWGSYRTEFYPTYDYKAIGMGLRGEKAL
jgi:hypothetical protein